MSEKILGSVSSTSPLAGFFIVEAKKSMLGSAAVYKDGRQVVYEIHVGSSFNWENARRGRVYEFEIEDKRLDERAQYTRKYIVNLVET